MTGGASSSSSSEEERAFLRRRIALAGVVAAGSFTTYLLFRTVTLLVFVSSAGLLEPSYLIHLASCVIFLVLAAIAWRAPLSSEGLRHLESFGFFFASTLVCAMGAYIPLAARPDMIVLLALTFALMARSTMIPSSGRRTLILSLAVGVVMLAVNYRQFLAADVEKWRQLEGSILQLTVKEFALWLTITQAVWWSLSTAVSVASSHVIYGLRRKVKDALQLGQYRLEAKIGEGGMGEVYRARHALLRRPTAIKLLRPDRAGEASVRRFETEVQLTAKLTHPNTVTIFDYGRTADGLFYYAMELVDGTDLERLVATTGPQEQARVRHILLQVAAALVQAHGVGLIHRDIKPANIMLTLPHSYGGANDLVKLLDFGLVKEIETGDAPQLTQRNTITGTPQYLSPEAIRSSEAVDARSDLYAVGAVAYYLLTGRPVFEGPSVVEVCSQHLHTPPDPIRQHRTLSLSPALERVVLDCLAKSPDDRPASARVLEERLLACVDTGTWSASDALGWWQSYRARGLDRAETSAKNIPLTIDAFGTRGLS